MNVPPRWGGRLVFMHLVLPIFRPAGAMGMVIIHFIYQYYRPAGAIISISSAGAIAR